jgi:superfamily I DNA/RNA helicase
MQPTEKMCAVTFTRAAAQELKERIVLIAGNNDIQKRLAVGTFHSIALSQMKRMNIRMPRILSENESQMILKRCWTNCGSPYDFNEIALKIGKYKSEINPVFQDSAIEEIYHAYNRTLAEEKVIDYADILKHCVQYMQEGKLPTLPVRWLLVDESQDMDEMQVEWVLKHGHQGIEVTIVGDDDQSLYGFRAATGYEGMQRITKELKSTVIILPVNYRCRKKIVEHSTYLINHNMLREAKPIVANDNREGHLEVIRTLDEWDEARKIARAIKKMDNGKWGILARTNHQLDYVELVLSHENIPCRRYDTTGIWTRDIASVYLGLLRLVVENKCDESYLSKEAVFGNLLHYCFGNRIDPGKQLSKAIPSLVSTLKEAYLYHEIKRYSMVMTGVYYWIINNTSISQAHKEMLQYMCSILIQRKGSLAQRLQGLTEKRKQNTQQEDEERIVLLTMHSAKGLEYDHVWILGCNEGYVPHLSSPTEEERRIFYVGMTRAKETLVISSILSKGQETRFIKEAKLLSLNNQASVL